MVYKQPEAVLLRAVLAGKRLSGKLHKHTGDLGCVFVIKHIAFCKSGFIIGVVKF